MAKICNNCACYEVCFMANPCRTEDCNIGWQPIVVRCKDCKHYLEEQHQCEHPTIWAEYCSDFGMGVEPGDFCSYGERKDND